VGDATSGRNGRSGRYAALVATDSEDETLGRVEQVDNSERRGIEAPYSDDVEDQGNAPREAGRA
jgi:hypothetical protein